MCELSQDLSIGSWAEITDDIDENIESKVQMSQTCSKANFSDSDLRNKLNINRRRILDNHTPKGMEDSRTRYTHRAGGLSPLRSPIDRSRNNVTDPEDTIHFQSRYKRLNNYNEELSIEYTKSSLSSKKRMSEKDSTCWEGFTSSESDIESGTPVFSRHKSSPKCRQSWSRRKLHLPSENDESDDNAERMSPMNEEDKVRLARREKDIAYGKATDAYKTYVAIIPKKLRSKDFKLHPRTPDKLKICSRRSWDSQVKIWKRRIHTWAELHCKPTNKALVSSASEDYSVKEETPMPEDKSPNIIDNSSMLDDDDDESFLDDVDINFDMVELK
ncbi:Oocyte-specific histone RNA stem-loop-binding protein 2 [Bulinus truncatus]|nr:Oocyte-specific histone RNA stem-loop-binding protein 2 [Bulinus truncatus]